MAHQDQDLQRRIGRAILALRERAGLSQAGLAERMGLNRSAQTQLGRYERGERIPRADTLYRILQAAEGTLSDLGTFFDLPQKPGGEKPSGRAQAIARELVRIAGPRSSRKRS